MKCRILHESAGRLRFHVEQKRMSLHQADILEYYLKSVKGVQNVRVYDRTGDAIVSYRCERSDLIQALACFSYQVAEYLVPEHTGRAMNREYEDKLTMTVVRRFAEKLFLPTPIQVALTGMRSGRYIKAALRSLAKRKIEVALLDGIAIFVSMLRKDYDTASSVMFLLKLGDILEEWTHKKSVDDLAQMMSLNVENVWRKNGDQEELVSLRDVKAGDVVVVRTGNMIPLDGRIIEGEASVNQASITGESLPAVKRPGSYVYAGTAIEEGECQMIVEKASGSGRYDKIVRMIEESEKLQSLSESKASHLADKLVPYNLAATALTYLLTRNATKALSILMVDFSCALKLSMPLAVLSAMRESSRYNITVKGGKYLEAIAQADTIVLDKTGTLTHASPRVAKIIPFGGNTEDEMLRLAACLEEHYPHSIANAVVQEAKVRKLEHEERHSRVEYVVAHGISSSVDGQKVVIGSHHFVFTDEHCRVPEGEEERFASIPEEYSHLYLAVAGTLAAVLCIEDPLRSEAPQVIAALKKLGNLRIVMMTGDNEKTAASIAKQVGVDAYYSEVLPEDKAAFVKAEHDAGRRVIMVGDGVNDSPALSASDAGIAIESGAAIAREIADVIISSDDLEALVTMKEISDALMRRIHSNFRFIIGFNTMLIGLGLAGVLMPGSSALLHNTSTIAISVKSMTDLVG